MKIYDVNGDEITQGDTVKIIKIGYGDAFYNDREKFINRLFITHDLRITYPSDGWLGGYWEVIEHCQGDLHKSLRCKAHYMPSFNTEVFAIGRARVELHQTSMLPEDYVANSLIRR